MTYPTLVHILLPEELFAVGDIAHTLFMFGTDRAYRARYSDPAGEPGTPWAFPLPAVLSATPQPPAHVQAHLRFGSLVTTPGYGVYRLEPDHNRNVKFVEVAA